MFQISSSAEVAVFSPESVSLHRHLPVRKKMRLAGPAPESSFL